MGHYTSDDMWNDSWQAFPLSFIGLPHIYTAKSAIALNSNYLFSTTYMFLLNFTSTFMRYLIDNIYTQIGVPPAYYEHLQSNEVKYFNDKIHSVYGYISARTVPLEYYVSLAPYTKGR